MPGNARHRPFTFTIGSRGYVGCGWNGVIMYNDVWEYDPGTDSWAQKANYPSGPRLSAFGFSIGNKGYAGCGLDQNLYVQSDVFEYNPATNTWTPKASWIGTPVFAAAAAVVNNKGYVFCGDDWDLGYIRHQETYAYDPATNSWAYVTNFPADGRRDPCAFALNNKIYVGTGSDNSYNETNDWWEYNPVTNSWTAKANFAGSPRSQAVAFAVMGKGYLGTGGQLDEQDFFEYDPLTNTWTQTNTFPGQGRENSASFVIGNYAYVVCGTSGTNYHDLWEFNPLHITGVDEQVNAFHCKAYPNPAVDFATLQLSGIAAETEKQLILYNANGAAVLTEKFTGNTLQLKVEELAAGMYPYAVFAEGKRIASGKLAAK